MNRVVCEVDNKGNLVSVFERLNVSQVVDKIVCNDEHSPQELPLNTHVSMKFWCFHPSIFRYSEKLFHEFLEKNIENPKSEFFIPIVADQFINDGEGVIKVIPTSAQWFGVTYKEDAPEVKASLNQLIQAGEYPGKLFSK